MTSPPNVLLTPLNSITSMLNSSFPYKPCSSSCPYFVNSFPPDPGMLALMLRANFDSTPSFPYPWIQLFLADSFSVLLLVPLLLLLPPVTLIRVLISSLMEVTDFSATRKTNMVFIRKKQTSEVYLLMETFPEEKKDLWTRFSSPPLFAIGITSKALENTDA